MGASPAAAEAGGRGARPALPAPRGRLTGEGVISVLPQRGGEGGKARLVHGGCGSRSNSPLLPRERDRAQVAQRRRRALPRSESCWCRCRRGRRRAGAGAELKIPRPPSRDPEDGRRAAPGAGVRPHGRAAVPAGEATGGGSRTRRGRVLLHRFFPRPPVSASPQGKGKPGERGLEVSLLLPQPRGAEQPEGPPCQRARLPAATRLAAVLDRGSAVLRVQECLGTRCFPKTGSR